MNKNIAETVIFNRLNTTTWLEVHQFQKKVFNWCAERDIEVKIINTDLKKVSDETEKVTMTWEVKRPEDVTFFKLAWK